MVYRLLSILLFLSICVGASAQTISGTVTDEQSGEPLIGATVKLAGTQLGTVTDIDGHYAIHAQHGSNQLEFSYIGYSSEARRIATHDGKDAQCDVTLAPVADMLDEVVVSAGRFEQNLNEVSVSMAVMKAVDVKQQAPGDIQGALKTISGVDIVDKQPSIRGGGGWTYSVGARSQILLDGMSILSPKTGEINWNSIPMENLSQIEVIKGASSVLYGSNALNGVINIRTERPGLEPVTHVSAYLGIYGKYDNDGYNYASGGFRTAGSGKVTALSRNLGLAGIRQPIYEGLDVSHTRRIGNFDLSLAGNVYTDEGYREQAYNQRAHLSGGLTYNRPAKDGVYINYGANLSYMGNQYGDFFIWRSPKEPNRPSPVTNMGREENIFTIDPFFNYTDDARGLSHKLRARVSFMGDNLTTPTSNTDVIGWLKNQTLDTDRAKELATNLLNGDLQDLLPLVSAINNEDYGAMMSEAVDLVCSVFPDITTTEVMDVAGFVMQLLQNQEDVSVDKTSNYYVDYQFAKQWQNSARLTAGCTWTHLSNRSAITGDHASDNAAVYLQYDQKVLDCLSLSAGTRIEYYRVDSSLTEATLQVGKWQMPVRPVFRAGLNWQAGRSTFVRASFGQGYRNPSVTEKFCRKDIGGVGCYPSHELKAESGFNAEVGFRQLFSTKSGRFRGSVDAAAFYTEYRNMIEFQFGLFDNTTFQPITSMDGITQLVGEVLGGNLNAGMGIGAQFVNVDRARIYGAEVETTGDFEVFRDSHLRYSLSYLFTEPEDVNWKQRNAAEAAYTDPLQMKYSSNESKYLKYRNKHTVKLSLDYAYKWVSVGTNLSWRSKILAVDYIMVDERQKEEKDFLDYGRELLFGTGLLSEFLTGNEHGYTLGQYWAEHNTDYWLMDIHVGARCTDWLDLQLMVNNLLNTEYSYRPMALGAPRTFVMKANFTF